MKDRNKEMYFVFSLCIIFLMGLILGGYLSVEVQNSHQSFLEDNIEECNHERLVYQEVCGYADYLIENEDVQECYLECRS